MVQILSRRESSKVGVTWDNINKKTSVDDNFTLATAFGVLILDCVIYGILTWLVLEFSDVPKCQAINKVQPFLFYFSFYATLIIDLGT